MSKILRVHDNPLLSKSVGAVFPTACAHLVSLGHILVILEIFQTFIIVLSVMVLCNQ
jgi:hypothetical protein